MVLSFILSSWHKLCLLFSQCSPRNHSHLEQIFHIMPYEYELWYAVDVK